jgi:2-isopropylmalate synthase
MKPEDVGLKHGKLVLGKHSGRHAFKDRLSALGHVMNDVEINKAFERFKILADKKKNIYDEDIESIIEEGISAIPETFNLVYFNVTCGNCTVPTATIQLKKDGKVHQDASSGDGPIDAAYKTIDRITGLSGKLLDYNIKAVTGGQDALGEVNIKIQAHDKRIITGRGSSTDIIEASVKAYLNAINKIAFLSKTGKTIKLPLADQTPDRM